VHVEHDGGVLVVSAGQAVLTRAGERVEAGQVLATLHAGSAERLEQGRVALAAAYEMSDEPVATAPLVLEKVG